MLSRVVVDEVSGCWLFQGVRNRNGYGCVKVQDPARMMLVHRVVYEHFVGPITAPTLDHTCRVRHCCNPDHLVPRTVRENVLRGVGPSAQNAAKTQCPKGHPYEGREGNARRCVRCRRERQRTYYRQKQEQRWKENR